MQEYVIETKIVKVGNSKGIVIPKKMLGILSDSVRLRQNEHSITIEPITRNVVPQEEWEALLKNSNYDDKEFSDFDITLNDGLDEL